MSIKGGTKGYIAIEGCMGAGKTTLAKGLAEAIGARPLIEESAGHPFIRDFYLQPDAYAIETEIAFILLHYHQIIREGRTGIFGGQVVSDFILERDYVFSRLTLREAEDWNLFEIAYTTLRKRLPTPDILIYLQAPIDFLAKRMAKRGRDYEKSISRTYLEAVNGALDAYFLNEYQGRKIVFSAPELETSVNPAYIEGVVSRLGELRTLGKRPGRT